MSFTYHELAQAIEDSLKDLDQPPQFKRRFEKLLSNAFSSNSDDGDVRDVILLADVDDSGALERE